MEEEILPKRRRILVVSLSARNPDAVAVAQALADVPARQRSEQLLGWAAAYLQGRVNEAAGEASPLGLSEEELDQLLDDF